MQPGANSTLFLGYEPKTFNYVFNISSIFIILQIIYDYYILNLGMIIIIKSETNLLNRFHVTYLYMAMKLL